VIDAALWLRAHERAHERARRADLADQLIATLPKRPTLTVLAAADWPLLWWLAPRVARAQAWRMLDEDSDAIDDAMEQIAMFAEEVGLTVTWPKRAMLVHLPGGAWRIEGVVSRPGREMAAELRGSDAVVAEDLAARPPAWLAAFVQAWRGPVLSTLNRVAPAVALPSAFPGALPGALPRLPPAVDGRAGGVALARLAAALRRRGDRVLVAGSDVVLRGDDMAAQRAWIDEMALAAQRRAPRAGVRIGGWVDGRTRQMMRGRLRVRLPCRDLLALPALGARQSMIVSR
jgi:hypothetical protein